MTGGANGMGDNVAEQMSDTMDMIAQLQQTEKDLYQALIRSADNTLSGSGQVLTETEQKDIRDQINSLSASRVTLYDSIEQSYNSNASSVSESRDTLVDQTSMLQVLEDEMNKSKTNLTALETNRDNQLKMVEINTYQSKSYDAQRRLMRFIAVIGVILLVIIVLGKVSDQFSKFAGSLITTVIIIGGALTARRVYDMSKRTANNYDEYQWWWTPRSNTQLSASEGSFIDISGIEMPYICAQDSCCGEGTVWSDGSGCVMDTDPSVDPNDIDPSNIDLSNIDPSNIDPSNIDLSNITPPNVDTFTNYNPLKTCGQKTPVYGGTIKAYNQNFGVFDSF